jgi:tight adherence protein B
MELQTSLAVVETTVLLAVLAIAGAMGATVLVVLAIGRALSSRKRVHSRTQRFMASAMAAGTGVEASSGRRRSRTLLHRLQALRPVQRMGILLGLSAVLFGALCLYVGWLLGLPFAVALLGIGIWLPLRESGQRKAELIRQLPAALRMIAATVESGHNVQQALERAAQDMPPPISDELAQVVRAIALGQSLQDALTDLALRVGGDEYELFATMLAVQYRVGGDLGTLLTSLTTSIEERLQFEKEVSTLTAQARYSGWILMGLPFFVSGILLLTTPDYVTLLITRPLGNAMLGFGAVLLLAGLLMVRAISKVEI